MNFGELAGYYDGARAQRLLDIRQRVQNPMRRFVKYQRGFHRRERSERTNPLARFRWQKPAEIKCVGRHARSRQRRYQRRRPGDWHHRHAVINRGRNQPVPRVGHRWHARIGDKQHPLTYGLPADIAIFAAAVADWRVVNEGEQKLKKTSAGMPPLQLVENPDILATISKLKDRRPPLVIGFAAETEHLIDNAKAKIARKGCDWIVANDVSPATGVMGGDRNTVHLLTHEGKHIKVDSWPVMTKEQVAAELVAKIAKSMEKNS
jgi:hypothetical protein